MIDHVFMHVKDYDRSKRFYMVALYAAFVRDPDGHNVEVVCHKAE